MGCSGDTIVALATPQGKAALAVIRLSGPEATSLVSGCVREKLRLAQSGAREVGLYILADESGNIDQVTAVKFPAPRSYTGDEMVEITCHGGPAVVARIMARLCRAGARLADPGEFTRRAFLNGKMDLMRAEAVRELIESESDAARRGALAHLLGEHSECVSRWRRDLVDILSWIEARIEFPEDDDTSGLTGEYMERILAVRDSIQEQVDHGELVGESERGLVAVISGPRNAGKSTLFNLVVGSERAIVHARAGTTRDVITERVEVGGARITVADTAGIGVPTDELEGIGIARGRTWASDSDVLIWVTPGDRALEEGEEQIARSIGIKRVAGIVTGADRGSTGEKEAMMLRAGIPCRSVSLIEKRGGREAREFVMEQLGKEAGSSSSAAFRTLRQRQLGRHLVEVLSYIEQGSGDEVVSHHIRGALAGLDELVGMNTSEEVLDFVFSRFCIGK